MATAYLRPLANCKRVKLVSTCDVCKNRKVKCDKERPECGTCKKTKRNCSYTYATLTETMRDKQSGMRAQTQVDSNFIQKKLNYLITMQFGPLYDESGYLLMGSRGFGIDVNESQHISGMLTKPMMPMTMSNVFDSPDETSILTPKVLSDIVSFNPKNIEQQQYDLTCSDDFSVPVPQTSMTPQQLQHLSPQQLPQQQMPQQPPPHQPPHNKQTIQQRSQTLAEDAVMEDLITNVKNMNIYESTRYIGEGSLLMIDEENKEIIVPQMTKDISDVDDSLKFLPNSETFIQLIDLYYKHVHRYFPIIRKQVVWNALEDLSKPQHLLLLNCIFFIASPFHDDPNKNDGRIYFDRAEALLYEYCTQPHALTVMSIILLGRQQIGSCWMYNGIATKMLFELGLHRKLTKIKMDKEVEKIRNEAFWMTFISENLISAIYGRPNMIDETDCDIDVPSMPSNSNPTDVETKLEIAYIYLINLSRICARVRNYMHSSRLKFLMQDESKFRVLDAELANWFNSLPDWLRFENIVKDPDEILLNGIGGDIHIFFYTLLILLHGKYMEQFNANTTMDSTIICIQSATIIVHWLEILLDKHASFFKYSSFGSIAINPAMYVFSWHIKNESEYKKKSQDLKQRLEIIKFQVDELSEGHNKGKERWLNIETIRNKISNHEIRDWEVFIPDDDKSIRKQYSWIARKQSGGHILTGKRRSRSKSILSSMDYDSTGQDFNFVLKTDKTFDFSVFSSEQPQFTVDGSINFDESRQFERQDLQQFGSQYQRLTSSQQSPQPPHKFHIPLSISPQLQPQEGYPSQPKHFSQFNSPLEKSQNILPNISRQEIDLKPPNIDTSSLQQQYNDNLNNIEFDNNNNNNILWTPPQSARSKQFSNTLVINSSPVENSILTPPIQPQDIFSNSLNEDEL